MAEFKFVTVYVIARAHSGGHTSCIGFAWSPITARRISEKFNGLTALYTHYKGIAVQHGKDLFFVDSEKGVFKINPLKKMPRGNGRMISDANDKTLSLLDPKKLEYRKYFRQEPKANKPILERVLFSEELHP